MNIAIILALTSLVSYFVYVRLFAPAVVISVESPDEVVTPNTRTAARAKVLSCTRVYNRIQLKGYVENIGNTDLSFVTVTALWKDENSRVVESAIVYAVKDMILSPGERSEFEASSEKSRAARCNVELLDWWT